MCAIVCRRNNPLEVNQFYPLSKNCPFEGLFLFHEKLPVRRVIFVPRKIDSSNNFNNIILYGNNHSKI